MDRVLSASNEVCGKKMVRRSKKIHVGGMKR